MWVPGPLQEQPGLSQAEPSLQNLHSDIFIHVHDDPQSHIGICHSPLLAYTAFYVENLKDSMKKLLEVRHGIQHQYRRFRSS